MPYNSNKQQETYADMINRIDRYANTGYTIPIGIYCCFALNCNLESCEVSVNKMQSVNKRSFNMSCSLRQ